MESQEGYNNNWRSYLRKLVSEASYTPIEEQANDFRAVAELLYAEADWFTTRYQVRVVPKSVANLFKANDSMDISYEDSNWKKVISFSLWGDNPKYTNGAIQNAALAMEIYPGWICRYYHDLSVPKLVIDQLKSFSNVELIEMSKPEQIWMGSFWRFYALGDSSVDITICRDVDSMLTYREKSAVDQFIKSELPFHIIRDYPLHRSPMLAGLFGYRGTIVDIEWLIDNYLFNKEECNFGIDQLFLGEVIYPFARYQALTHDEFYGGEYFPCARIGTEFAGQYFPSRISQCYEELLSQYLYLLQVNKDKGSGG